MRYDANGNLILDIDRGISVIHYNLLNLPDTIQFGNGNQIVNLYDATGHKYRSIIYTVPSTAITPIHGIVHYALDVDTIDFLVTEYAGSIENKFSRTDTIQRIHNTIGYYTDGAYFHYLKDHLGNICAVVRSTTDDVVQQTQYYASGVPMQSNTLSVQPYLYNSKELVTAHELNEYDSKARMYYATIMRTTTMDPLCEKYYHISPYAWCGNNPIQHVDANGCYFYDFDNGVYRSSYGNHDVVEWSEVQANDYEEPEPSEEMNSSPLNNLKPLDLVLLFFLGTMPSSVHLTDNSAFVQQFTTNNNTLAERYDMIQEYLFNKTKDSKLNNQIDFSLNSLGYKRLFVFVHDIETAFATIINESIGKAVGNMASSVTGSYSFEWRFLGFNKNGDAVVAIRVTNPMSAESFFKPPFTGYSKYWQNNIQPIITNMFKDGAPVTGAMAPINITMDWITTIPNPNK
jgi:RHS repeat-associated protein